MNIITNISTFPICWNTTHSFRTICGIFSKQKRKVDMNNKQYKKALFNLELAFGYKLCRQKSHYVFKNEKTNKIDVASKTPQNAEYELKKIKSRLKNSIRNMINT
jgi:predicted RNA binding protein YcfA (HicA-like mRNA interferase family)